MDLDTLHKKSKKSKNNQDTFSPCCSVWFVMSADEIRVIG
jgi:hypothetical protein